MLVLVFDGSDALGGSWRLQASWAGLWSIIRAFIMLDAVGRAVTVDFELERGLERQLLL